MTTSIAKNFNYRSFVNYYYSDSRNVLVDPAPPTTLYYDKYGVQHTKVLDPNYIVIKNKRYYVQIINNNGNVVVFFTQPVMINGELWDNHYHFGVDTKFDTSNIFHGKKKGISVIYFHKTIQEPHKIDKKTQTRCYFLLHQPIDNVADIDCLNTKEYKMTTYFPVSGPDFDVVQEIIRRPFYGVQLNGGKRKTRRCKIRKPMTRKRRTIH